MRRDPEGPEADSSATITDRLVSEDLQGEGDPLRAALCGGWMFEEGWPINPGAGGCSPCIAPLKLGKKKNGQHNCKPFLNCALCGGAKGDRTPDLMTASHALSQLSYGPTRFCRRPNMGQVVGFVKYRAGLTAGRGPRTISVCSRAGVVKLVDALDSKSSVLLGRVGSSPTSGTTQGIGPRLQSGARSFHGLSCRPWRPIWPPCAGSRSWWAGRRSP
jgi:hypothetical protein